MNLFMRLTIHNSENILAFTVIKFFEIHFKGNYLLSCKLVVSEFMYYGCLAHT